MFFHFTFLPAFPPVRHFLPLISASTGFHKWGLVTRRAQLLITSNYHLPRTSKDPKYYEGRADRVIANQKTLCCELTAASLPPDPSGPASTSAGRAARSSTPRPRCTSRWPASSCRDPSACRQTSSQQP